MYFLHLGFPRHLGFRSGAANGPARSASRLSPPQVDQMARGVPLAPKFIYVS